MPAFVVEFSPAAVRDLKRLDPHVRLKLLKASSTLAQVPYPFLNPQVKLFTGMAPTHYRLRVGDYRIVYRVEGSKVIVTRIAHRREVYR